MKICKHIAFHSFSVLCGVRFSCGYLVDFKSFVKTARMIMQNEKEASKIKELTANFSFIDNRVSFTVHNRNASFDEVEVFLLKLREEIDRQLANKKECPFYERFKCNKS